jgi:agmatinase
LVVVEKTMSTHGYEAGRLNLPFVGHCSFGKQPICTDWDKIDADAAVLGVPYDMGTQYRSGARFGPRAIREASTLFSFGHSGAYDFEDGTVYLPTDRVRIVDVGDADIVHTDTLKSHANTRFAVRKILQSGAIPLVLGGDHSSSRNASRAAEETPGVEGCKPACPGPSSQIGRARFRKDE